MGIRAWSSDKHSRRKHLKSMTEVSELWRT
jgi:hypothetical protein